MTLLNNWLASLPFMTAERADYVISSFWPMMEGAIFIYDSPGGHFLLLRFIHCGYRSCDLHIATFQFNDQNSAGHLPHLYFNYSWHANVGANLHYLLRFT